MQKCYVAHTVLVLESGVFIMSSQETEGWVQQVHMYVLRKRTESFLLQDWIDTLVHDLLPARRVNLAEAKSEHESDFFRRQVAKIESQVERLTHAKGELVLTCDWLEAAVRNSDRLRCTLLMEPCNAQYANVAYIFCLDEV